ncbi:hypothetical protein HPB49_005294 [Dermacentor silvarum]|uniref:Uncharacterized protein n=1 Tax=Dermacentor silvarum TaxID=543639 RepID=A0ACB8DN49_DERSI|nr:hypothetical protein HPB49_005294 [Dermacentor silvarum]
MRHGFLQVKQVLGAGGITWPLASERADFLSAIFYMARHVHAPVFFDVVQEEAGAAAPSIYLVVDTPYEMTYAKLTELASSGHAEEHFRACCQAFSGLGRCHTLYSDFVEMKSFLDGARHGTSRYTPSISEARWEAVVRRFFNVGLGALATQSLDKFASVFRLHDQHGEQKALDLVGWLAVQVLIHYTNSALMASFYREPDIAERQQRQLCFAASYSAYDHAVNRLLLEDAELAIDQVRRLAEEIRAAFRNVLRRGILLRGSSVPEPKAARLNRTFEILEASMSPQPAGEFPEVSERPLKNKILIGSHLRKRARSQPPGTAGFSYDAYDPSVFGDFRIHAQHLNAPWYVSDAPPGVLLGGLGMRLAGALFIDYVERSLDFRHTLIENRKCLGTNETTSERFGEDLQAATASINVVWSLYEERSASRTTTIRVSNNDVIVFKFACWLFCGDLERGSLMCNTFTRHSPHFSRVFRCRRGSSAKCVMGV